MDCIGYEIACKQCRKKFWVCRRCYRGHKYCSSVCKATGYKAVSKRAKRKYESSPEARKDHRDRQRRYLERCQSREHGVCVTDESSRCLTKVVHLSPAFDLAPSVPDDGLCHCFICN